MPKTKRRATSRLLKLLSVLQTADSDLTAPFCVEIKHLLKNNQYLTNIEIATTPAPYRYRPVLRDQLPNFILSQLDGQRLTNGTQPTVELTVELTDLLGFVLSLMPAHPPDILKFSPDKVSPTFFNWQCAATHRTRFLVAFIRQPPGMTSAVYSVEQLLGMRDHGASTALSGMAVQHPDLADLIVDVAARGPPTALSRISKPRIKSKSEEKKSTCDASSTDSDEIVYKGNPSRRGIPQETEWKFRGRSESEAVVSEPLPAPTGLNAQRNEGFQRFYKAVVSPSHVRVTAGGRIVPNTRGSSSPIPKRAKDKGAAETSINGPPALGQPDGTMPAKWPAMPMLPPPYYPHYPGPFPHMAAHMGMMPMAAGFGIPGGFPYPPPHFVPSVVPNKMPASDNGPKENRTSTSEEAQKNQGSETDKTEKTVKISPPEQFDHTRPFVYNGQVMVPFPTFPHVPPAAYMAPPMMGHHPAFALPFAPPPHMMPPAHGPVHPGPAAASTPSGNTGTKQTKADVFLDPPAAPPISSIRPSDITRKQIESLRNALKYHEDQLQYNRHQIDEKEVQKTVEMLLHHIARFEGLNKLQSEYEAENYPRRDQAETKVSPAAETPTAATGAGTSHGPAPHRNTTAPLRMTRSEMTKTDSSAEDKTDLRRKPRSHSPPLPFRNPETVSGRPGINISQSNYAHFESEAAPTKLSSSVKKPSTLPSGAALAAPFEPRAVSDKHEPLAPNNTNDSSTRDDSDLINSGRLFHWEVQAEREARLLAAGAGSWGGRGVFPGMGGHSHSHEIGAHAAYERGVPPDPDLGRPYLVGTLPAGMDAKTAKDADYVYERELTEEETRARYLYWGKAPLFARQGLPNYDGRNFYPASSIKHPREFPELCVPTITRDIDVDFGNGLSTTDPFRPATPTKRTQSPGRRVNEENTPPRQVEASKPPEAFAVTRGVTVSENDAKSSSGESTGFLNGMLVRGITRSSDVLPSAVSSTTAHGILPQYSGKGSLQATLSPVAAASATLARMPSVKAENGSAFVHPSPEKIGENRRPPMGNVGVSSLEEQFRDVMVAENKQRAVIPHHWKT